MPEQPSSRSLRLTPEERASVLEGEKNKTRLAIVALVIAAVLGLAGLLGMARGHDHEVTITTESRPDAAGAMRPVSMSTKDEEHFPYFPLGLLVVAAALATPAYIRLLPRGSSFKAAGLIEVTAGAGEPWSNELMTAVAQDTFDLRSSEQTPPGEEDGSGGSGPPEATSE